VKPDKLKNIRELEIRELGILGENGGKLEMLFLTMIHQWCKYSLDWRASNFGFCGLEIKMFLVQKHVKHGKWKKFGMLY